MACRCEEEFNPWPSFVDIFSSVILTLLLFLLVLLANLGYFAQFKYKVSYTGSVSNNDIITDNSTAVKMASSTSELKQKTEETPKIIPNSDKDIQIINEQKQKILALENQLAAASENLKSAEGSDEVVSAGVNVADKKKETTEIQKMINADEYFVVTYKSDELFVDDSISKKLKDFLAASKSKYPNLKIVIYSSEIQGQLSATISKQISLARTMSVRNLIKKFDYEKKDIKVDLATKPEIKETVDAKNGYLVIKIIK